MRNVRFNRPLLIGEHNHREGETAAFSPERAAQLVGTGAASYAPPVLETATKAPPPRRAAKVVGKAE